MQLSCRLALLIFSIAIFCGAGAAQIAADNQPINISTDNKEEDRPKNIKETSEKMRIEREKKDHQEMIDRGEDAVKLSAEVKKSFDDTGKLSGQDLEKLSKVEKIVKKIRSELGGNDDGDEDKVQDQLVGPEDTSDLGKAVYSLKAKADTLDDELKKTTRFTISAAAIFSSNAVLKLARTLRFGH